MPLPVAHSLVGASIVIALHPRPAKKYFMPLLLGGMLANCPDLDFLLVWLYHAKAWHRAFTHSLVFALFVSAIIFLVLGRRRLWAALAYGLAFTSHGLLDFMMTKVGGGVQLLWPFSVERFGLRLIGLSELPSRLPPLDVLKALLLELLFFAPLFIIVMQLRQYRAKSVDSSAGIT